MLEQIMNMVGGNAISAMTEDAGISKDQTKSILPLASEILQEELISKVTDDGLDDVLGLVKSLSGGGLASNGLFESLKGIFMTKIMTNMDLPESVADKAADTGMTSIIGGLTEQIKEVVDTDDIDANLLSNSGGVIISLFRDDQLLHFIRCRSGNHEKTMLSQRSGS